MYSEPVTHAPRRNVTNFISMKKDLCTISSAESENYKRTAIIIVLSARNNFKNRNLVRESYGSIKYANNVKILAVVFMLGNEVAQGKNSSDANKIRAEIDQFGDIIIGDFVDTYRNLTLKTIMAYEWLTSHCRQAQFVVKTDDDVLVNIFQLTKVLDSFSSADFTSNNIWCTMGRNESTIKNVNSKFYASPKDFPNGIFPVHCQGVGYVTTMGVIDRIADEISRSFLGRVCTHEDVFMTGIVVRQINLVRSYFWQRSKPIELINKRYEWRSIALERGVGDEDGFLRNLINRTNTIEIENLGEFRKKCDQKIFYLINHSGIEKNYIGLWQIINTLIQIERVLSTT